MSELDVRVVRDDAIADSHDWMLLEFQGHRTLVVKTSAMCPKVLREAREACGLSAVA